MSEVTQYQKFDAITIPRSMIKNAEYNPRIIHAAAKAKLKKSLKKNGLVETLVWNRQTGNLVGGHQRLGILDDLEGGQEYQLTVAQVDIPLRKEKALNIFLNNPVTQGEFAFDMMKAIKDIDWEETGFDPSDISYFKADEIISEMENNLSDAEKDAVAAINEITAEEEERKRIDDEAKIAHVKHIKELQKNGFDEMTGERYAIITFKTITEKKEFLLKYGFPENEKYIDGLTFEKMIQKK